MSEINHEFSADAIFKIAHDLGAPFRQIARLLEIVAKQHEDLPDDTLEILRLASSQGYRASSMLQGLITVEAAESTPTNRKVLPSADLGELLACRVSSEAVSIQIEVDPSVLALAVQELVDNARRYSELREVVIDREADSILVQVCESSSGLTEDQWKDALLPFCRLDGSKDDSSLGLGLSRAQIWSQLAGGCLQYHPDGIRISIPVLGS